MSDELVRITLTGDDTLIAHLVSEMERLEDVSIPLLDAAYLERDLAVERIKEGGDPPWPPSKKTLGESFVAQSSGAIGKLSFERGDTITRSGYGQTGIDEGTMMRALEAGNAVELETQQRATVSVNVRSADGRYNYARIFQEGSGVYAGHSEWVIEGRPFLSWMVGGTRFFSRRVTMHGQPPRRFLYVDGTEEKVLAIFREWMNSR